MDKVIKEVLNKIESNGFEAYIVGGYVRDLYLGIKSTDIDISTNALPKDLLKIFKSGLKSKESYGSFRIKKHNYQFDITTYRKEAKYVNRRPTEITYINNLVEDLQRRDFTVNSLCMNQKGQVIDLLNGIPDIEHRIIRAIGSPKEKFKEDPLRILRAIRFSIVLDFNIEAETNKWIKKYAKLVRSLSYDRKKEELEKIFVSKNIIKGLEILKKYNILNHLEIKYKNIIPVNDLCGIWAQIEMSNKYPFTKQEIENINIIKKIIKYGKIDNITLFDYGLYLNSVAGSILGLKQQIISKKYNDLPINSLKDIQIETKEIIDLLKIKPSNKLKEIINDLKLKILNLELKNENKVIKDYLVGKL